MANFWEDALKFIPIVGPIVSSAIQAKSVSDTNKAQKELAEGQRQFQKKQTDTAHQREVADLKAAGLNPILSANAGAASAAGVMAELRSPFQGLTGDLASSARAGADVSIARQRVKTEQTVQELNKASTLRQFNEAKLLGEYAKVAKNNSALRQRQADMEQSKFGKNILIPLERLFKNGAFDVLGSAASAFATAEGGGKGR